MALVFPAVKTKAGADGKGGECCPCTENMSPCGCSASYQVQCRTRGAGYSLCGFSEITSPSIPPKKYKACAFTGQRTGIRYSGDHCDGSVSGTFSINWSGSATYDVNSCTLVSTGTEIITSDSAPPSSSPLTGPQSNVNCHDTSTKTRTTEVWGQTGDCCPDPSGGSGRHEGSTTSTLQSEDTESAAIARASKNIAWSPWLAVGGSVDCCAYKTLRKAGQFVGAFQEAELKLIAKGGPNAQVTVEVVFNQRPLTGGAIAQSRETYQIFCDGAGDGEVVIKIPSAAGYEICYGGSKQI